MFRKIFPFFLLFLFVFPSFADFEEDSQDELQQIFDLVEQVVSSPEQDSFDDSEFFSDIPYSSSNNNLLVVNTSDYSLSDIASSFYEALARSEAERLDEFSEVTDIQIMPLYTPDTGTSTIPTGSLRYVLTQVIGPYSPVVVQYQYNNGSNTAYLREIYPDYVWMISAAMFALVLYCVFRLWGSILCKR